MKSRIRLSVACIGLVCAPCINASAQAAPSPIVKRTAYEDLQMFGQVLNQIRVNHPDSVDSHELFMAAVQGMIRAADPHSYVIPAMRLAPGKEQALREGKLVSIPITFAFIGGTPVVVSVAAGSAARQLDILPGDELIAADGAAITSESAEEMDIVLSGGKGSAVRLSFERRRSDGTIASLERTVKRETVAPESAVPVATMVDSTTGYVRVTTFMGEKVADDLHNALDRLEKTGLQRLVLDLRDNGGGALQKQRALRENFFHEAPLYTRRAAESPRSRIRDAYSDRSGGASDAIRSLSWSIPEQQVRPSSSRVRCRITIER